MLIVSRGADEHIKIWTNSDADSNADAYADADTEQMSRWT